MRELWKVLFLTVAITSCGEDNPLPKDEGNNEPERVVEEEVVGEGYWKSLAELAERAGFPNGEFLKVGMSVSLAEGGPVWIVRHDEAGRFSHALLFRWSDYDQHPALPNPRPIVEGEKRTLKVYRETIRGRLLRRVELNADEIAQELREIEDYLIGVIGEGRYRFYYQGGRPDEPEQEPVGDDSDPFASEPTTMTADQMRETVNQMNHHEAASVARQLRGYRATMEEAENQHGKRD
jgi:hypothetical protein